MSKRTVSLVLLWVLLLAGWSQTASAPFVFIPRKGHMIVEDITEPESVDPAWAYDTGSRELIFNVYEPLIFFDRENMDVFKPSVASSWLINQPPHPSAPAGTVETWYFEIKDNIYFQPWKNSTGQWQPPKLLTTDDVEYSFERWMVQSRHGGPTWMINEPLFQRQYVDWNWPQGETCPINLAVESNSTHVWFNLAMSYPPLMQILSQSWASIVNKKFCIYWGDWHGVWEVTGEAVGTGDGSTTVFYLDYPFVVEETIYLDGLPTTAYTLNWVTGAITFNAAPGVGVAITADYKPRWIDYSDPAVSPLDAAGNVMCGTGPYMLEFWNTGWRWSVIAYRIGNPHRIVIGDPYVNTYEYHGGWPAPHCSKYLDKAWHDYVPLWGMRLGSFRAGGAEQVYVPRSYIAQVEGWPGIRGIKDLPELYVDAMFFNFDINPASPYIGTGAFPDGIPVDFFSDINIRKAFAHIFNYTKFLEEVWLGEAVQPKSPVVEGLSYHNPDNPKYSIDLTKAEEYFIAANNTVGGPAEGVWEKGFSFNITYITGNVPMQTTAEWIRDALADMNQKFQTGLIGVTWPTYLRELWFYPTFRSIIPLFIMGKLADYPDAHDFVKSFMNTEGYFAYPQSYSNALVDELIDIGIRTPDTPWSETLTITNTTNVEVTSPNCSNWTDGLNNYHMDLWHDGLNYDGQLSVCDYVEMNNTATNEARWYHVESLTVGSDITLELEHSRKWIYYFLQQLYYEDIPSVGLAQPFGRHWERDWVQGWYYNPLYPSRPDNTGKYFYHLWKGLNGDINGDDWVNALDVGKVNYYWYYPPVVGIAGYYDPIADITPELQYALGGLPEIFPGVPHPSIGRVDVFDLALINAHWLEWT